MKPIIFVLGPSGVGKSYLLKKFKKKKFLCTHLDTDKEARTFEANGFPSEWDRDYHKVDPAHLMRVLRGRLDDEHAGAVVSFPTTYVFTPEKLVEAAWLGVTPVVLWGKQVDCVRFAEMRINSKGKEFDLPRYEERNGPTFEAYSGPEYDDFRVEAFRGDGSRYPDEEWLARIMERTAG